MCPLRNISTQSVIRNVKREWIGRHGAPETLLTDQGQQVDGLEIRDMCEEYGIEKKHSSPYHPQGDGVSERPIGVMKGVFRSKLMEKKLPQCKWPEVVPDVQLAMNTKKHASTKFTPYELMYGTEYRKNSNHHKLLDNSNTNCKESDLAEELKFSMAQNVSKAKENLKKTADKMKMQYDRKIQENDLHIGDLVYIKKHAIKGGESKKLAPLYHSLSKVVDAKPPTYCIENVSNKARKWMHYNELKLKPKLVDEEIERRNSKKRRRSQVETEFSEEEESDDELECMGNDTEGEDTSEDEYNDARDEIDDNWTPESKAIQVEQRISANEIQQTAAEKTVDASMTEQASRANDNSAVPDENVVTPEEKLGRHYDEQGLRKSSRISKKKQ